MTDCEICGVDSPYCFHEPRGFIGDDYDDADVVIAERVAGSIADALRYRAGLCPRSGPAQLELLRAADQLDEGRLP
jgi:hypothetical protein